MVVQTRQIGGGFIEGFFNSRVLNLESGKPEQVIERVLGGGLYPELELLSRLRVRFPNQQLRLKPVNKVRK